MNALVRNDSDLTVTIAPEIEEQKNDLLCSSFELIEVENDTDNEKAAVVLKSLRQHVKEVESSRKEIKAPVLAFGKAIDAAAKAHVEDLNKQGMRIAKLSGNFLSAKEAKRRAEIAAENERLAKIERERQAELAKADTHDERDFVNDDYDAKVEAEQVSAPVKDDRPKGQRLIEKIEITVPDVKALYRAYPHLVDLNPRQGDIRELVKTLKEGETIPGVAFSKEMVASVSSR